MEFSQALSSYQVRKGESWLSSKWPADNAQSLEEAQAIAHWQNVTARFFSPLGVLRYTLMVTASKDLPSGPKPYEIAYPNIPRYFTTHFESGVKMMQLNINQMEADRHLPNNCFIVEKAQADFVLWFVNGSHVSARGVVVFSVGKRRKKGNLLTLPPPPFPPPADHARHSPHLVRLGAKV
jgi:hypothetical protein